MADRTPQIFICYAHKDNENPDPSKRWLDRLLEHLAPLELQGQADIWSDQEIELGEEWHDKIQATLQQVKAAVLLVSPSFLASKYIRNSELPVLLKNAKDKGVVILPILLRQCLWRETQFRFPDPKEGPEELSLSSIQIPSTQPLNSLGEHEQDEVLYQVAQRIYRIVNTGSTESDLDRKTQQQVTQEPPFTKGTLLDLEREMSLRGYFYRTVEKSSDSIIRAIVEDKTGLRIGISIHPDPELRLNELLSMVSRELAENIYEVRGVFAIQKSRETEMQPYELNKSVTCNAMHVRWNEIDGREVLGEGMTIFSQEITGKREELSMSDRQRLVDLKELLELLYEKLGDFERELIVTASTPAKFELKQRIKREILPSLRQYEAEYWELYPQEAILISDEEAASQLVKVEQAVGAIERIPQSEYPPELIPLLQEIRAKLDEGDLSFHGIFERKNG